MNLKSDFYHFSTKHLGVSGTLLDDVSKNLTPMILEERELNVTQLSVFDRLMLDRILWLSGVVDERMADVIQAQLLYLDSVEKKDITMYISSPGGNVLHGLGIIDVMDYVSSDIITTNIGMSASMGAVLLSAGTKGKRNALISSKTMLHHVSSGNSGVIDDMRISMMEAEKYNYLLIKKLAENCNKSFDEVHNLTMRDKWLNSDEALKFNIIDNIIGLNKHKSISDMMDGFDEYYKKYVVKDL